MTKKMWSQKDPMFSNLCDRVGADAINDEDERFLRSRILHTPSEENNENFKSGQISIIVTTNKKRNLVNSQKLAELLPNERLYSCNSDDRIVNLPENIHAKSKMSANIKDQPGKTGNLLTELHLKLGAPVIVTTHHPKLK